MAVPSIDVTPYLALRYSPTFTCWDLVALFYLRELALVLPHYRADPLVFPAEITRGVWEPVSTPARYDVALFRKKSIFHIGVLLAPNQVLHLAANAPASMQPLRTVSRAFEETTFYHHHA